MRAMAQLTVVEAARISAIVEEALEKLSFLASITPDVMAHRDELSQIVGDEITRIIQEQRGLEARYEELLSQRASLKALSNKARSHPHLPPRPSRSLPAPCPRVRFARLRMSAAALLPLRRTSTMRTRSRSRTWRGS